jgi:cell division protein FtsQ
MKSTTKTVLRLFIAGAIFTGMCAAVYLGATNSAFRVNDIEIVLEDGDPSFIFPAIKATLDKRLSYERGQFIWQVDIERVLGLVEQDRRVKDVKVARILPNSIRVRVVPHIAIANILGIRSDVLYPIARDGSVLPAVEASEAPDSPILRGENFLKNSQLRGRVIELLDAMPEAGAFSREEVSELYLDKNNDFLLTLKKTGTQVNIGHESFEPDFFKTRAGRVNRVLNYLENQKMVGRVIDARYSKKVVVKLRNEP